MLKLKKTKDEFSTPYTCMNAIKKGGIETKLSMVLMGFGNFVHKQKIKGLLYLAVEAAYLVFMLVNGIGFLSMLGSLGSVPQKEIWDEANQIYVYNTGRSVRADSAVRCSYGSSYTSYGMGMERNFKKRL